MPDSQTQAAQSQPEQKNLKWKVLVSVVFGIFMVILDTTVVNVAFQTLRSEFGASLNDSQWIISVYVLSLGVSTPLAGYLSDRFGIKKVYLTGLTIFVLGSFLCGVSPNLGLLIAARALQGFGGGIALPLGSALLLRTFPPSEQGVALGIFGIALVVAPAIGPILGGFLVDHNLWRAIFFINPPIGILGIILGSRFLPNLKDDHKPAFDFLGLVTEIIGFGAILYAASVAANNGWNSPAVLVSFVIGVIGLIAFALIELFVTKEPLLDLRLYTRRTFLNASLLGYVSVIALFGAEFMMPIFLQALRGKTAFETGLILLPMAITSGVTTIIAGRLYDRVGPRPLVAFGFLMLIINTWQLSQIKADTPIDFIILLLALRGLAVGATVQTTFVTALSVVPLKQLAGGSSLTNATRNVFQAIGIAILATVLASTLSPQISALQQQFQNAPRPTGTAPVAICTAQPVALINTNGASAAAPFQIPGGAQQLLDEACKENIAGFERAYTVTFYAAFVALFLGLLLPGWPFKFAGRRAADAPPAIGH
ncbi:MAG TPA: DHA2 family efflux MFS transporter permease subunit [Anaerolineaceae bacterium]|nr:DHA2 family efflux MFS transporter permease subunit [Anaerolineaceae bacterium]